MGKFFGKALSNLHDMQQGLGQQHGHGAQLDDALPRACIRLGAATDGVRGAAAGRHPPEPSFPGDGEQQQGPAEKQHGQRHGRARLAAELRRPRV